jgi:class 3 adenylate cyclase
MSDLPKGAVTMFFADIEGSTPLVHRLEDAYGAVLGDYRRLLRRAVAESGGHEVDCRADELFAVFEQAEDGVEAAVAAQRMLAEHA